jgi:hypothetical protein
MREWSAEKRSGACEAPLADLAIDPPEHRAKAFARLAIGTLAFRRSIAAFIGPVEVTEPPGSGVTNPARRQPHPVPPARRLMMTPSNG